ncbi:hypothetical protein [Kangiella spongicola]|uniref:hypothetical protein n=1 Tax=Kangiella spongicola TaxID=796379 RepID=UPI0018C7EE43|nr:hypothetical protein [Kangiella spongicola]
MKIKWLLGAFLFLFTFAADCHSGRLDKNGGHNCSKKSQKKGLCYGNHNYRGDDMVHSYDSEKCTQTAKKYKHMLKIIAT